MQGDRADRGKSDPIDAHLAVLTALRLDAGRLPTARADGDREALRYLRTGNEPKLRWRTEDHRRRTPLAAAVAELGVVSIVVVGTPMQAPE